MRGNNRIIQHTKFSPLEVAIRLTNGRRSLSQILVWSETSQRLYIADVKYRIGRYRGMTGGDDSIETINSYYWSSN